MLKRSSSIVIILVLLISGLTFDHAEEVQAFSSSTEVRGVWIAYIDYSSLGLKTDKESVFRNNFSKFLTKAKSNNINTIFFHVRSFDDAAWKSKTFKPSKYLTSKSSFSFDPLKTVVEMTHKKGMELHAWMNPYRISHDYYLDPSKPASTSRIKKAVSEVTKYEVDGIHFDDYFYHANKGYKDVNGKVTINAGQAPSAAKKRAYVNKMVKALYSHVKGIQKSVKFGISPQGNIENCMNAGADVKTWLNTSGYIDYIAPQIYWSNQWGGKGNVSMFTDRLKAWKGLNKKKKAMYVGLALYRTGISYSDDPGWKKKSSNLASQLNLLRNYGYKGYLLFSSKDFGRKGAQTELKHFKKIVRRIPTVNVYHRDYRTIKVSWNRLFKVNGYAVYRATSKSGTYKRIKNVTGRSYHDTGLTPGKKYYYKVKSYRVVSGKRKYSSSSSAAARVARPKAPIISSKAGSNKIKVSWTKSIRVHGYVLYSSTQKAGKYRQVKETSGLSFTNQNLKKGQYYYKVRAFRTVKGKRLYSSYSTVTMNRIK